MNGDDAGQDSSSSSNNNNSNSNNTGVGEMNMNMNEDDGLMTMAPPVGGGGGGSLSERGVCGYLLDLANDLWQSSGHVANNKLNWLLVLGPVALMGDATGLLGETACFAFSGLALIPCAERLSYVTEQVAMHTNGTIGALLNATFGNAPELLIASAALLKGFYRVVQLAMLGSMLTNLLFVFGISCLIGGFRWQVQELRLISGNVNVGMLLLSTAGSLLPATLVLGGQLKLDDGDSNNQDGVRLDGDEEIPSLAELQFCRVNAVLLILMYGCYLVFQLGTHKEEFDEEDDDNNNDAPPTNTNADHQHFGAQPTKAQRNVFCMWLVHRTKLFLRMGGSEDDPMVLAEAGWVASPSLAHGGDSAGDVEMTYRDNVRSGNNNKNGGEIGGVDGDSDGSADNDESSSDDECLLPQNNAILHQNHADNYFDDYEDNSSSVREHRAARLRRIGVGSGTGDLVANGTSNLSSNHQDIPSSNGGKKKKKTNGQRPLLPLGLAEPTDPVERVPPQSRVENEAHEEAQMSFRVGLLWLLIITLGISAMSEILVDTISGFAIRLHMSEVFTSMVIVPFFSNVAEQVSAILFAYRNEMDLCVGVTVGSAIQVAAFVLPGCVIIGWMVDRSMTLYFHAYETICLFLAVVVVAAVLQGGSTNWLVGATCVSVYMMIATGFWFHSVEDLSVDAETLGQNLTRALLSTA